MKFAIVGGLGYIGSVLQKEIESSRNSFEIIDNDIMGLHNWKEKLDISNPEHFKKIKDIISKCDLVVNLAAIVGDQACLVNPKLTIKINSGAVQNLVDICNRLDKKIIQISTCSIYGASNEILDENSQTFPVDFYGQTKFQQEKYVMENAKNFCVLRLGTAFGWSPRMRFDLVVNTFNALSFNNEPITVYGGEQWRPMVHIRDVSRAIIYVTENNLSGIYNICNENLQIKDVAKLIEKNNERIQFNDLMSDPRNYRVSNKKIISKGFNFDWDLKKGIAEIISNKNELENYRDAKYSNYKMMLLNHHLN